MIQQLKDQGWYLTDEGLGICKDGLDKVTAAAIVQKALDTDLREIGGPFLSDEIYKDKTDHISGPCVLQIQKLKNVTAPKYETSNSSPPLLRLLVTDGHVFVSCLQWGQWKSINLDTPPGTKIFIKPVKVQVQNGFLLLSEKQFTVLGGHVSAMVEKWELGKSLASHVRRGENAEDGPPPWIPFGKSINYTDSKAVVGNFKSLEHEAKEQKDNTVFKQQRLANIAEVSKAKEGKVKVFGGGKDKQPNNVNNEQTSKNGSQSQLQMNDRRGGNVKKPVDSKFQSPVHTDKPRANENFPNTYKSERDGQRAQEGQKERWSERTDDYRKPETERFKKFDGQNKYGEQRRVTNFRNDFQFNQKPNMRDELSSVREQRSSGNRCEDRDARTRNENERNNALSRSYVRPGAEVLARYWEDNRFYRAKIHAVGENETCVVCFVEYGNYEEVRLGDIRPFSSEWNPEFHNSTNVGNDGGMYFTGVLEFRRGSSKPYIHRAANADTGEDHPRDRIQRQGQRPAARLYQPPRMRKLQS